MLDGGASECASLSGLQRVHNAVRPPLSLDFQMHRGEQPDPFLHFPGLDSVLYDLHYCGVRGVHEQQSGQHQAEAASMMTEQLYWR
jgi:hypothetical protein